MADVDLERLIDERARAIIEEREAAKVEAEEARERAEAAAARARHVDELEVLASLLRGQLATLRPAWGSCALTTLGLFFLMGTSLIGLLQGRDRATAIAIVVVELHLIIPARHVIRRDGHAHEATVLMLDAMLDAD